MRTTITLQMMSQRRSNASESASLKLKALVNLLLRESIKSVTSQ